VQYLGYFECHALAMLVRRIFQCGMERESNSYRVLLLTTPFHLVLGESGAISDRLLHFPKPPQNLMVDQSPIFPSFSGFTSASKYPKLPLIPAYDIGPKTWLSGTLPPAEDGRL
jgi:hypothetical protein